MIYKSLKKVIALIIIFIILSSNVILAVDENSVTSQVKQIITDTTSAAIATASTNKTAADIVSEAQEAQGALTADMLIKEACNYLGVDYPSGEENCKGYKNPLTVITDYSSYNKETDYITDTQQLDCSGFIYVTLRHLGIVMTGFIDDANSNTQIGPVPVNSYSWHNKTTTGEHKGADISGAIATDAGYSKLNITHTDYMSEFTTENEYLEFLEKNNIKKGDIVLTINNDNFSLSHMWIYLGQYNTKAELEAYLASIGVTNTNIIDDGSGSTHWLIESTSNTSRRGVTINNHIPEPAKSSSSKAGDGFIAYTIVSEKKLTGTFDFELIKTGNVIQKLTGAEFTVSIKDELNNTIYETAQGKVETTNEQGVISIAGLNIENAGKKYTVTIKEISAPEGYNKLSQDVVFEVESQENADKTGYELKAKEKTNEEEAQVTITNSKILVEVNNTKKIGTFDFELIKTGNTTEKLNGAEFTVSIKDEQNNVVYETAQGKVETTNEQGLISIVGLNIENAAKKYTVTIKEITAPEGYNKLSKDVVFEVESQENAAKTGYELKAKEKTTEEEAQVTITNNKILVEINNIKKQGKYDVKLIKVDTKGNIVEEVCEFTINGEEKSTKSGVLNIATSKAINEDKQTDTYEIVETKAPEKYGIYKNAIKLTVVGKENANGYELDKNTTKLSIGSETLESGKTSSDGNVTWSLDSKTITIKLVNKQFDLALYKWVTTTLVTEDGVTKQYESGHTQSDKTNLVNVSIPKQKLNDIVVKFKYTIKVENQGEIEGYAKQIKDHIPEGLKFVEEDNKEFGWKLEKDGTITTRYLENTLLQPGETAEVIVVLTWINSENNLNQKVNYAEISEDYNDYGDCDDVDSTPDNFKGKCVEDDEDSDVVMLQIRTGSSFDNTYLCVGLGVVMIISCGVIGIKKFVL